MHPNGRRFRLEEQKVIEVRCSGHGKKTVGPGQIRLESGMMCQLLAAGLNKRVQNDSFNYLRQVLTELSAVLLVLSFTWSLLLSREKITTLPDRSKEEENQ